MIPSEFRSDAGADRLGLGANSGQAELEDDEFDQYRKRMMLAYRFRPNPMVNSITISKNIMQRTMYESEMRQLPVARCLQGLKPIYSKFLF